MAKRRTWTIVFVPDDETGPRQFRIGPGPLRVLVVAALLLVAAVGVGAATYWKVASVALETTGVKEENSRLAAEAQKIWEIERLMGDILEMDYKLRSRLGIDFPQDWPGYRFELGERSMDADSAAGMQTDVSDRSRTEDSPSGASLVFRWPVYNGFPTSDFGDGGEAGGERHTGIDIAAPVNAPVTAAADGQVVLADRNDTYGNVVEIDHGNGLTTFYGHNARLVVRRGQLVRKGDIIAYVGNTGRATTGPHLHFEVRKHGEPLDPMIYLPKIY